jgi:hypothetical protein
MTCKTAFQAHLIAKESPKNLRNYDLNNCKQIFLRPLFCHFLTNFTILRPPNFSGHRPFFGISFELFGRKFGHLATVPNVIVANQVQYFV